MKKETILFTGITILFALIAIIGYLKMKNESIDSLKFKNEYEALNSTLSSSKKEYPKLELSNNNPIKYSNYDELINVIKKGTGIIYLGFPECPWCRSALPVLFNVAKDNDIDKIYYLNIKNDRDVFVVKDDKLVYDVDEDGNEKKGVEGYFKLLKALDKHLTDYIILYEGKEYNTEEKRIYAPTVIFVKNGKVLGLHVSTVDSQKTGYDKMTKKEKEELYGIYEEYILEMNSSTCQNDSSC